MGMRKLKNTKILNHYPKDVPIAPDYDHPDIVI